jgi:hypothetical protein
MVKNSFQRAKWDLGNSPSNEMYSNKVVKARLKSEVRRRLRKRRAKPGSLNMLQGHFSVADHRKRG